MNRRVFLRGLGGAVVAAPYLSSVAERAAKGQTITRPKQLIAMFTNYGCVTTKWFPVKSHGPLVASDLANSLAPLQPYVGKVLIPRGIRAMNEWTQYNKGPGRGLGQGNDSHLQAVGSYFTLQPVSPNSNDPFSFDMNTKFTARPVGTSLDHVMAQQLSASGVPLFMRVGNTGIGGDAASISYLKADGAAREAIASAFPGLGTPAQVFSALTGLLDTGAPMSPATYAAIRGKKVTDLVKACLEDFERQDMSGEDRRKVAAWKALVNDTGAIVTTQCTRDLATRLGATSANLSAATMGSAGMDILTKAVTPDLDGADMYSVMAVLATVCNYNPVIVLKYPANWIFRGLGLTVDSGSLSHRLDNAGLTGLCLPNALAMIRTIDTYYASKFAKLVGMLDGIKNADGSTLLDGSAAVWFNEMSDGLAQNLNNLPIIQAGSCGGTFKTGWAVNVENGSATLTQGNSEAQCADGTGTGMVNGVTQATGTDPTVASAPINKYFYNLMNAVGVKADASGYPTQGGTAEVTRFGYSDLTTDFCGGLGAIAGATIHSPGEYTSLKAGS